MLGTLASTYRPIFVVPTSSDRPQSHPSTSNHPIFTKLPHNHLQHPFYPLTSKNPAFPASVGVFLRSLRVSVVLWLCRPRSTLQNRRIRSNNRFIDDFCDLGALQSPYCSLVKIWPISRPILRRFRRALRGQDRLVVSVIVVQPACRYVPPLAHYGSFFVECWISGCWFGPLWSCCCSVVRVCRF